RPQTIFMNRRAFDRLTPTQRGILLRAGREAIEPELARIRQAEAAGLAGICGRGTLALATVTSSELAALRERVRPVYAELERDRQTRELIDRIRKLRAEPPAAGPEVAVCAGSGTEAAAAGLHGVWQVTT